MELIRRGEYFAAHEVLEDAWRAAEPDERDFFQGLVHVAVAWYQAGRGKHLACKSQIQKAMIRLSGYGAEHHGVNLRWVRIQLFDARRVVKRGSLDLPKPLDRPRGEPG